MSEIVKERSRLGFYFTLYSDPKIRINQLLLNICVTRKPRPGRQFCDNQVPLIEILIKQLNSVPLVPTGPSLGLLLIQIAIAIGIEIVLAVEYRMSPFWRPRLVRRFLRELDLYVLCR